MVEGSPQALLARVALATALLAMAVMSSYESTRAGAQSPAVEGTVRLLPAISTVSTQDGPFTVFIVLEDLEHFGQVPYDDDRDTVPDRELESVGLGAFQFSIEFDPTVLAPESAQRGPDLGRSGRSFQCLPPLRDEGRFTFGCLSPGAEPPGPQGTMTLASVAFRPLRSGSSPLLLDAELSGPLGTDDVPVAITEAVVRVMGGPAATPTPLASSTVRPTAGAATATPSSPVTEVAPRLTPTAPGGRTPAFTATGTASTPASTGTPGAGLTATAEPGSPGEDGSGGSFGGAALWSVVIIGTLAAVGGLGAAAMLWRRAQHGPAA